jgi:hypothetical protein
MQWIYEAGNTSNRFKTLKIWWWWWWGKLSMEDSLSYHDLTITQAIQQHIIKACAAASLQHTYVSTV